MNGGTFPFPSEEPGAGHGVLGAWSPQGGGTNTGRGLPSSRLPPPFRRTARRDRTGAPRGAGDDGSLPGPAPRRRAAPPRAGRPQVSRRWPLRSTRRGRGPGPRVGGGARAPKRWGRPEGGPAAPMRRRLRGPRWGRQGRKTPPGPRIHPPHPCSPARLGLFCPAGFRALSPLKCAPPSGVPDPPIPASQAV